MKGTVSFFSSLSESAVRKNGVWYKKYQSFTKVLFQQPAIYVVSFHFLWLFDDVNLFKEIQKPETINIAFIFSSLYFCLFSVTRRKCLCIFFPLEIVQILTEHGFGCLWPCWAVLSSSIHYSSQSVGFYHWLNETSWTEIYWLHLSVLKNGLWPSSCPSMGHTHQEEGSALAVGGAVVTLSHVCAASCNECSGSALGGSLSAQTGLASRVSSVWCSEGNEFIRWWHHVSVLSQHVNHYKVAGDEIIRVTMESFKAPPVHFGQDSLTATLTPAQMPALI